MPLRNLSVSVTVVAMNEEFRDCGQTAYMSLKAVEAGVITASEYMSATHTRVRRLNTIVHAFCYVRDLESCLMDVSQCSERRLRGLPIAVKDLTLTKGIRTELGSLTMKGNVPPFNADVVTAMTDAGLVVLGKTSVSEFGLSLSCDSAVAETPRNPWAISESAGGSSGGSAAAVASGMLPWAHGTDGGGSNRVPAALCGVLGYKPTRGVVSHGPLHSGMLGLPTSGPIARTVDDLAMLLEAMKGTFPGEPHLTPASAYSERVAGAICAELGAGHCGNALRNVRVGWHVTPMFAETDVARPIVAAVEKVVAALDALGLQTFNIKPQFEPRIGPTFRRILAMLAANPLSLEQEALLAPLTRAVRAVGANSSAWDLLETLGVLQNAVRAGMRRNVDVDFMITPTLSDYHLPVGGFSCASPEEQLSRELQFSPFCPAYTLTGEPALSVPVWVPGVDRPMSVMLAARCGADHQLLALAKYLESIGIIECRHPELPGGVNAC